VSLVKRAVTVLVAFIIAADAYAAGAAVRPAGMEASSNRHVHTFNDAPVDGVFTDTFGFKLITASGNAELWLNEEYHTVRIKNKTTGYIWGALPLKDAEGLSRTWQSYGNSVAAIECYNADGIEQRFGMHGNADAVYAMTDNGFDCSVDFTELGISFELKLRLTGNKLTFQVPQKSISEAGDYLLKSVTFLPFLGAVYGGGLDGYLFIPDGSGALIRFRQPSNYSSTYDKKIYGPDLSIETVSAPSDLNAHRPNDYTVDEQQVTLPVCGIVHGAKRNGLFCVVEDGDLYASITATPALTNNPYNRVAVRFDYRQKYSRSINRKSGAGSSIPQEHRNALTASLAVYILDGPQAHYDGMAVLYRELLRDNGTLAEITATGDAPLRLEILGADKKKEFIGSSTQVFTTVPQTMEIMAALNESGISNVSLVYRCFTKNNEAGLPFIGKLGSEKDFNELAGYVKSLGGRFYLYANPVLAKRGQINLLFEAANNLSNTHIKQDENYFYRLTEAEARVNNMLGYGGFSFAADRLPSGLYGDYTSGREATRGENFGGFVSLIEKLARGSHMPLYRPNGYMLRYASEYYDAPLAGSQLLYETDSVPFLQIVLSGSVELFGTALNTGTLSTVRLLRHIEYGTFPSFVAAACESIDLFNTAQQDYSSVNFNDWQPVIHEAYEYINGALAPLRGQSIVSHTAFGDGFIKVVYDGGSAVYVNYTDAPKTDGGVTVDAMSYKVTR
jgi:hypothetical protein